MFSSFLPNCGLSLVYIIMYVSLFPQVIMLGSSLSQMTLSWLRWHDVITWLLTPDCVFSLASSYNVQLVSTRPLSLPHLHYNVCFSHASSYDVQLIPPSSDIISAALTWCYNARLLDRVFSLIFPPSNHVIISRNWLNPTFITLVYVYFLPVHPSIKSYYNIMKLAITLQCSYMFIPRSLWHNVI